MSDKSIEEKLRDIIAEQLGLRPEQVKLDSSFQNDLGCDSLDEIELVIAAEEEFGIEIPDEHLDEDKLKTVGDAVNYLQGRLAPPAMDNGGSEGR